MIAPIVLYNHTKNWANPYWVTITSYSKCLLSSVSFQKNPGRDNLVTSLVICIWVWRASGYLGLTTWRGWQYSHKDNIREEVYYDFSKIFQVKFNKNEWNTCHFCMFGSYESIFYCWTPLFTERSYHAVSKSYKFSKIGRRKTSL